MSAGTYKRRKEAGICVNCGKSPATNGVMCIKCKEKSKNNTREYRNWLKGNGYCTVCGRNRLYGDEKMCIDCSAKKYEYNRKWKSENLERYKESKKKSSSNRYYARKEAGICVKCQKPTNGGIHCISCAIKHNNRMKKSNISRNERFGFGKCYICGKDELLPYKRLCKQCNDRAIINLHLNDDSEKRKNQREAFGKQNSIFFNTKS